MVRPTGADYAVSHRTKNAVAIALTIADSTIDDPGELINESPLFWWAAAELASCRMGVKITAPAHETAVQAVVTALRSIRAEREKDPFDGFPRVVE